MSRLLCVAGLMLGLAVVSVGQDLTFQYSPVTEVRNNSRVINVSRINGHILVARTTDVFSGEIEIVTYKEESLQVLAREIVFGKKDKENNPVDSKAFTFHSFLNLKGKTYILVESYIKDLETHELFAQEISQDGKLTGKLATIDNMPAGKRRNAGSFMVTVSADSTKFLVVENPPGSKDKKANESFGFKVYTSSLENINNLSITLPLKDINVGVHDYALGNDAFIYMLVNVDLDKKEKEKGQSDDYYVVYKVNPATREMTEIKLGMPGRSVETVAMKVNSETNKFFCAGLYSDLKKNKTDGEDIDGFFFMRFDPRGNTPEATNVTPLSSDMVNQLVYGKEKKSRKAGEGISDFFTVSTFDTRADGTALIVAEKRYVVESQYCDRNGCHTTYYYHRQNLFVIDVKVDGSVLSFTDIPKAQVSVNDGGLFTSYAYLQNNGKQYVIYNDHPDNISPSARTIKDVKSMNNIKKSSLFAAQIMKDGRYTKQVVVDNKVKKSVMMPDACVQLGKDTYVVPVTTLPKSCSCACTAMFGKQMAGIVKIQLK